MSPFEDRFSKQSDTYLKFRPTYPPDLFAYLSTLTRMHELAWDCGTGNGQSAIGLASHYEKVYATDPSGQQISNAMPHSRIMYRIERAEEPGLADHSADLVTVAQAIHWFEFDRFYPEVKRVLKEDGVIAAWAYGLPLVSPLIDPLVKTFHDETIGEFWQKENRLIEQEYATIPFPFHTIPAPSFHIRRKMSRHDFLGYIRSWSAVQKYIDHHGTNPVSALEDELMKRWPEEKEMDMTWKLILKVGRNTLSN